MIFHVILGQIYLKNKESFNITMDSLMIAEQNLYKTTWSLWIAGISILVAIISCIVTVYAVF